MEGLHSEHYHYHHLPKIRLEGLRGVFLSDFFRRMTISLIGLWTPIYIWQSTGELKNVAWYYFIYGIIATISMYPGALLIKKIGVDWGNVVGTILRGGYVLSLIFAGNNTVFFWISAASLGLCQSFDWLSYSYVVTKISKKEGKFGKTAGVATVIGQMGAALGPLLGGIIIHNWGFTQLYIIASMMLVLVGLFPFFDSFEKKGMHVSFIDLKKAFFDKGIKKHFFAQGIRVFDMISNTILWPLFLLLVLGSVKSSGALQTISTVLAMTMSYFSGKFVDKKNFATIYIGSVLNSLAWIVRFLTGSSLGLGLANTSYSLGTTMMWTPMAALLFARSSKKYTMEFWLVKEVISYLMISVACVFYLIVFSYIKDVESLLPLFPLLAGVSLLGMLIPKYYKEYIELISKK